MRFPSNRLGGRTFGAILIGSVFLIAGTLVGEPNSEKRGDDRLRTLASDRATRFVVELRLDDAGISGYFTEVTGLVSESDVVEYRDGNDPNVVRKLPGRLKYSNITLKRGVIRDGSLWQWRRLVETGNVADARANGTIVLLDRGSPVATWHFVNAWPAKISGPQLKSDGNDIAIEEIVIAHEGMTRE